MIILMVIGRWNHSIILRVEKGVDLQKIHEIENIPNKYL